MHSLKSVSLEDFLSQGYLMEINRCFLHPLGMALTYETYLDGTPSRLKVVATDDPAGFIFDEFTREDVDKHLRVEQEIADRVPLRKKELGYIVQPILRNEDETEGTEADSNRGPEAVCRD